MEYLVDGSRGFVGTNLIRELKKDRKNIVIEYQDDVCEEIKPIGRPSIVYHLAANTDPTYADDFEMYRNNVLGFLRVLEYSCRSRAKLIYASSAAIYGNGEGPLNAYAMSKKIMDDIAKEFFGRMEIVGLRFFNVYGQGELKKGKSASMITQWREQIKKGERPKIFEGEFKRDFIYIKDIVKSLLEARNLKNGIYDVGTGTATDFRDILKIVIKTLNVKTEPRFIKNPHLDKYQIFTKADISWGFRPDYTVESGIRDYFENYE